MHGMLLNLFFGYVGKHRDLFSSFLGKDVKTWSCFFGNVGKSGICFVRQFDKHNDLFRCILLGRSIYMSKQTITHIKHKFLS